MMSTFQTKAFFVARPFITASSSGLLQRKCACENNSERDEQEHPGTMQRKQAGPSATASSPAIVHQVLNSPGQPLDTNTRCSMEARFGHALEHVPVEANPLEMTHGPLKIGSVTDPQELSADAMAELSLQPQLADAAGPHWDFSAVRIHTDAQAAESARAVNALAYTVGRHIVFGTARFDPHSREGQHLLAHELAHTVQQLGPFLARKTDESKDKPKGPPTSLPPYKPKPIQPPASTDVPLGVTPCLSGEICEPPIPGSAWDFGKKAKKESTPRPATPIPAKEVKKAAEDSAPGVLKPIYQVTVNPGLSPNVAAQRNTCKEFNVSALDPSASCIEVPKQLEEEAVRFNQGSECPTLSPEEEKKPDAMCFEDRDSWKQSLVETMTHEAAHAVFRSKTPVGISARTSNEISLHELSELYAQLSEFPVHYRSVKANVSTSKDAAARLQTSVEAWVKEHVESEGEGFRGMLTKLRCINDCEKVTALIQSLVESVTAAWPDETKNALMHQLSNTDKLDWPMPAPNLRPAAPERPKMPPLYQPRTTFEPEIVKSVEELP